VAFTRFNLFLRDEFCCQYCGARGDLTFVEGGNHVPFDIRRVYFLYNVPVDSERGGHAHMELEQVVFATIGQLSDEN